MTRTNVVDAIEVIRGVRIGNAPEDAQEPRTIFVVDPTSGQEWCEVRAGGHADAVRAVDAASAALEHDWASVEVRTRVGLLRAIASALRDRRNSERLAAATTRETGKRLEEAEIEVRFSARYFDWFAEAIATTADEVWRIVPGVEHVVRRFPLGVVAIMTPWNFPVSIPARKLAPALAAGCAIVFRPSRLAPTTSLLLAELIERLLPAGVLNTVVGNATEVSDAWLRDKRVRGITFTGSVDVGRRLAQAAGASLKETVFELGGRAPFIVMADAAVGPAVEALLVAKYRNNGQSCIAANNVWVHERHWKQFVQAYVERSLQLRLGDPMDRSTQLGPLREATHVERLRALVAEADAEIRRPTTPARADGGSFLEPTICLEPPKSSAVWQEELFGPVTPIRRFTDLDEVIEDSNASRYGLAGYICSTRIHQAIDVAANLEIGLLGINSATPNVPNVPFAGVKASGVGGCEGGRPGLDPFMRYQSIAVASPNGAA